MTDDDTIMTAVTAEQLQAQLTATQATTFFVHDLVRLVQCLDKKRLPDKLSPIEMFVLLRDQAFFKTLFFSWDRPSDLGQVRTPEILRFPGGNSLLFNYIWRKTLRDGSRNLFDIRRNQNPDICRLGPSSSMCPLPSVLALMLPAIFCSVLPPQMTPLSTSPFPPPLRMPV